MSSGELTHPERLQYGRNVKVEGAGIAAIRGRFSAHVGEPIIVSGKQRLEDTAAYLVRSPLSLKKLVYLDGVARQAGPG